MVNIKFENQYNFRKLLDIPSPADEGAEDMLVVPPGMIKALAAQAFRDVSFYLRASHLDGLADVIKDPDSSENERYVCGALIKNAVIASDQVLPICQDTGTATVVAWKGENVQTNIDDEEEISRGIQETYTNCHLRYSQMAPLSMFEEKNTGNNMPAQIDINATQGNGYHFLFIAKGAGSSNKTGFFQKTRALLVPERLEAFLREKIGDIGADACPPYNIAVVIGGTSPERNLKIQKLATAGILDGLPTTGDESGRAFRAPSWEKKVLQIASETGIGAQFGGRHLALAARVIRLPRHGGSCPVSIGISCSAHRNIIGKINKRGVFLEELDKNPSRLLPALKGFKSPETISVDIDRPMEEITNRLKGLPVGALLLLNGPLIVARDMAHARIYKDIRSGKDMPSSMKQHPVCYAGPAKCPEGYPIGSFGPTTSQRMDGYVRPFMEYGASLISLGKGSRSPEVSKACREYGGFYLGTLGGAAALIAREHITSCDTIAFPEFGMEAVYRIEVKNLPAFILCNDKGEDFYRNLPATSAPR